MVKRIGIALLAVMILAPLAGVAAASAADEGTGWPNVHIVGRGETLYSIGRRYGVSPWIIARANGIANPNRIFVGQRLLIPTPGWAGGPTWGTPWGLDVNVHIVGRGDTLYSIGRRYGVGQWIIAMANGIANPSRIYVGQRLVIPTLGWAAGSTWGTLLGHAGNVHIVGRGETLYSIGRRYGVSPWIIAAANGIANPNRITVGQPLIIPPAWGGA